MDFLHDRLKRMLPLVRSLDTQLGEKIRTESVTHQEMLRILHSCESLLYRLCIESDTCRRDALEEHRRRLASIMPDNPAAKGWKVFSQNDEDGILQECLRRLSPAKTFMEFCCGDGLEKNTHFLLLQGFRGVWLDGSQNNIEHIRTGLGGLKFNNLWVRQDFLTLDNISDLLRSSLEFLGLDDLDVFSLDVDGNDIYFAEYIQEMVHPKILIVEYNGKFPPPLSLSIEYNPEHTWQRDDFHGASLQKFVDVLDRYMLVACNVVGVNAFFVRKDVASGFTEYPVELVYQPPRLGLTGYPVYHAASFKWLKQILGREQD